MPLVAHWPLHEDSGSTAYDVRGGNDGTTSGGITQGVTGILGTTAYSFDGADDYISGISSLEPLFGSPPVTVSLWVNGDTSPGGYAFDVYNGRWIIGNAAKSSNWFLNVYDGSSSNTADSGIATTGSWLLLTGVQYSNGDLEFYVNGKSEATATSGTAASNTPTGPEIGNQTEGTRYFPGDIADVRVYDHALTQAEVQYLHQTSNYGSLTTDWQQLQQAPTGVATTSTIPSGTELKLTVENDAGESDTVTITSNDGSGSLSGLSTSGNYRVHAEFSTTDVTTTAAVDSIALQSGATVYVYDGSSWNEYPLNVFDGSNWNQAADIQIL